MINDLYHNIGADLQVSATGDLSLVNGTLYGQQRVLRRLITNPVAYIWHVTYGGGIARMIGRPANAPQITGIIRGQLAQEAAVAATPPATVNITVTNNGIVTTNVLYTDADTGQTQTLTLPSLGP